MAKLKEILSNIASAIKEKNPSAPQAFDTTQFVRYIEEIPAGQPVPDYLCFTAKDPNAYLKMQKIGTMTLVFDLETSTDGMNFTSWDPLTETKHFPNIGNKLYIRGNNIKFGESYNTYMNFGTTGRFDVSGNIHSLLQKSEFETITSLAGKPYCFYNLFGTTSILTPPKLPAVILDDTCYCVMFESCTLLTKAPSLPAISLARYCYKEMFTNCTSLTAAQPVLPATTIAYGAYSQMFQNCTSLALAPILPGNALNIYSYQYMFNNCKNLTKITVNFTSWDANNYLTVNWVQGVAATGEFHCPSALPIEYGAHRIPSGWTVINDI